MSDFIASCIQKSVYWKHFELFSLRINMRLEGLRCQLQRLIEETDNDIIEASSNNDIALLQTLEARKSNYIAHERGQRQYASTILQICNGYVHDTSDVFLNSWREEQCSTTYCLRWDNIYKLPDRTISATDEAYAAIETQCKKNVLEEFYPRPFDTHKLTHTTILAATNSQVFGTLFTINFTLVIKDTYIT